MRDVVARCLPALLGTEDECVVYFATRDLLGRASSPVQELWGLREAKRILGLQLPSGCWRYPNSRAKEVSPLQDYDQLETYRRLGQLVEKYGLDRRHPATAKAAEYMFGKQTASGDFRGIYGRQYTPNYTAGIVELLVKAGYGRDRRVGRAFRWLLSIRQSDGGWAIPLRTSPKRFRARATHYAIRSLETLEPDPGEPSSAMVTGVVLRAFAAHERLRKSPEARRAAELLPSRFFKRDAYVDRGSPAFWERVTYPFWFTDIVSALDSLSIVMPGSMGREISNALGWLERTQSESGLFDLRLLKTGDSLLKHWESLAVCRVFRRYETQRSSPGPVSSRLIGL